MSHAALTARYRPQSFAQVAGQDTVKTILSRASLEGKVAPAYLFSGTRGVGKTTLARIFAKALNCRNAPTAEPCNQCDQCRAITSGSAVDVVEIDGASNRGIDDVRRLKEVVGYAAMEGGYKIFIIDEAHMLSREAFNALLKTLEEPPARVTFIMATTEPHKFPATIISRCQHYVFKPLPESSLTEHLGNVLSREGVAYEDNALRLIARRGAGSVRDSMSLLGQVLALGEPELTEESARNVLGLAGQEAFMGILEAVRNGDSVSLSVLLREMLDQGLDMGFFLRELASLWRNLFMLRQSGEAALPIVELPEKEARACMEAAQAFSLQHIHACWQMTLDGQRRVLTSLEPALALELLLLNIAMLPQLLPLDGTAQQAKTPPAQNRSGSTPPASPAPHGGATGTMPPATGGSMTGPAGSASSGASGVSGTAATPRKEPVFSAQSKQAAGLIPFAQDEDANEQDIQEALNGIPPSATDAYQATDQTASQVSSQTTGLAADQISGQARCDTAASGVSAPEHPTSGEADNSTAEYGRAISPTVHGENYPDAEKMEPPATIADAPDRPMAGTVQQEWPTWDTLLALCEEKQLSPRLLQLLRRAESRREGDVFLLIPRDAFSAESLRADEITQLLRNLFVEACGETPIIEVREPERKRKSRDDLRAEILSHPLVKDVEDILGARAIDFGQLH